MAGSLENRGKLRELIDKFQFVKHLIPNQPVEIFGIRNKSLYLRYLLSNKLYNTHLHHLLYLCHCRFSQHTKYTFHQEKEQFAIPSSDLGGKTIFAGVRFSDTKCCIERNDFFVIFKAEVFGRELDRICGLIGVHIDL